MAEEDKSGEEGKSMNREEARRAKQLERLNEYIQQMAYKPVAPYVGTDRTEKLAQTKPRLIIGAYEDHKDHMEPEERTKRVERIVSTLKGITVEQFESFIQQYRKKQAKTEQNKKRQQILYHETLSKLQKQCEDQLMNAIVNKFAKEVSKRASNLPPSNVETEAFQCLQKSLVCNMYLALKVPNEHQSQDYTIYNKLASVLADLILQALFLAQNADDQMFVNEKEFQQEEGVENTEKDRCIRLRALRAAKKKLSSRQRTKPTPYSHSISN